MGQQEGAWLDVSVGGDEWEVEIDQLGDPREAASWRHRWILAGATRAAWSPGQPPSGPMARNHPPFDPLGALLGRELGRADFIRDDG